MGFREFLGNERIVAALRGALRAKRVPHALLFTGPRGVGKFTLARMFAQAANCERLTDDFCGECATCQRISLLADPQTLLEQGLIERGESVTQTAGRTRLGCRARGERTKHQTPSSKHQRSSKLQAQARSAGRGLELRTWDFFGVWCLEL